MAIKVQGGDDIKVPDEGAELISRELFNLWKQEDGDGEWRLFKDVERSKLKFLTPHKIFVADLVSAAEASVLSEARFIGWRYLLLDDDEPIAAVELSVRVGSADVKVSKVVRSPGVAATFVKLNSLGNWIGRDDYELRFLRIRDLLFSGLWFHSYQDGDKDSVIPLPPMPKGFKDRRYPKEDFLPQIRDLARRVRSSSQLLP